MALGVPILKHFRVLQYRYFNYEIACLESMNLAGYGIPYLFSYKTCFPSLE